MIKELTRLANHLDAKGLRKEAGCLDKIIRKMAAEKFPLEDFTFNSDEMCKKIQVVACSIKPTGEPSSEFDLFMATYITYKGENLSQTWRKDLKARLTSDDEIKTINDNLSNLRYMFYGLRNEKSLCQCENIYAQRKKHDKQSNNTVKRVKPARIP